MTCVIISPELIKLIFIGNEFSSILVKKRKGNFKTIIDKTIKQRRVIKTISFSVEVKKENTNTRKLKSPPPLPRSFSEDDVESVSETEEIQEEMDMWKRLDD